MRVLVAGVGNVLLSDDGFAASVIRVLTNEYLGPGVSVHDFGTGGMHLALEMLGGYDCVIIVDAIGRNEPPGTVFSIDCTREVLPDAGIADPHAMGIGSMLALYRRVCEQLERNRQPHIFVVGCVPHYRGEGVRLSEPVREALPVCAEVVRKLVRQAAIAGCS